MPVLWEGGVGVTPVDILWYTSTHSTVFQAREGWAGSHRVSYSSRSVLKVCLRSDLSGRLCVYSGVWCFVAFWIQDYLYPQWSIRSGRFRRYSRQAWEGYSLFNSRNTTPLKQRRVQVRYTYIFYMKEFNSTWIPWYEIS